MPWTTLSAVLSGVTVHLAIFIRGEWHLEGANILTAHLIIFCLIGYVESLTYAQPLRQLQWLLETIRIFGIYLVSLFSSIAVYRLFFHRLRHFPGPKLAAVSKLWQVVLCWDSRGHLLLEDWRQKYGAFVRTGPEEISIFHPDIFEAMDGPNNRNSRSDWYDIIHPRISIIFTRNRELHEKRRRIWDHALSLKMLPQYFDKIRQKSSLLLEYISEEEGRPVFINDLMYWLTYDAMGDFAFSRDFGMLRNKRWHPVISHFASALALLGPFNAAVWIPQLAFALVPGIWKVKDWNNMMNYCDDIIQERAKREPEVRDIASWFLDDYNAQKDHKYNQQLLSGDAATLTIAGSDTSAPALISAIYFITRYPQHAEKIYEEAQNIDTSDVRAITSLPHLSGVVNEAMRLLPSILTASSRNTPPEGIYIDKVFIPGNTKICAPRYSMGRLESAWEKPHEFIPERWYARHDLIKNEKAFGPFGIGRRGCVGKHLALAQIKVTLVSVLCKYRIKFAPGQNNGEAVERDLKDQLTSQPGRLEVIFEPRQDQL